MSGKMVNKKLNGTGLSVGRLRQELADWDDEDPVVIFTSSDGDDVRAHGVISFGQLWEFDNGAQMPFGLEVDRNIELDSGLPVEVDPAEVVQE